MIVDVVTLVNCKRYFLQGKSQFIEAKVSRVIDATKKKLKSQELKHPLRIKVTKSPVIINYPLYQVGVSMK